MDHAPIRFVVHGMGIELSLEVPALDRAIQRVLGVFQDSLWPDGFVPTTGQIHPYDPAEVARYLSAGATAIHAPNQAMELYQDAERFWLIDDRWGLVELNLLKNHFRAWLLPQRRVDDVTCVENAILWPLAQLLRARGLHLLPAVSVARDGWGVLILTPYAIEPELRALAEAGYQIIGQRWTALREESNQISLLHLPGPIERGFQPRLRTSTPWPLDRWIDLNYEYAGARRNHAFCDLVLMVTPGRRPRARLMQLGDTAATHALRRDWPILELHPQRRSGQMAARLVQYCRFGEMHLSRKAEDFVMLLESLRPMTSVFLPGNPTRARQPVAV